MDFYVNGYLGVDLKFTLDTSVNGLVGNVPGTWTITTTNGVTGTITAMTFAGCTVSSTSVDVQVDATSVSGLASSIDSKIDNSGSQLCTTLNTKLGPSLIGRTIPL